MKKWRFARGFTLVELAVVLGIISVVMGSALALFTASLEGRALRVTQERMAVIQKALYDYRVANDRIPCPADAELAVNHKWFGLEGGWNGAMANVAGSSYNSGSCVSGATISSGNRTAASATIINANYSDYGSVKGMIPVRTLGLSDDYAFDGWGRRVMYTVDRRYTAANGFSNWRLFEKPAVPLGSNRVEFLGYDTVTGGNWIGRYGSDGVTFSASTDAKPSYVASLASTGSPFTWHTSQTVIPAYYETINAVGGNRRARCWYSGTNYNITVNAGALPRVVTFYLLDYDSYTRRQRITVLDGGTTLETRDIEDYAANYHNGVYLSWLVRGTVIFRPTLVSGANAVVSMVLFDTPDYVTAADEGAINSSRITVRDAHGNYRADKAVYALWSAGKNGHGAYSRAGGTSLINAASANAQEQENCDCNAAATKTAFDTEFYDASTTSETFDDVVVFANRLQMRAGTE